MLRPTDLVIPELVVETPSPTKTPMHFLGSPPPQKTQKLLEEAYDFYPSKHPKLLTMQFEKPGSLDFPFAPPMITITANFCETESDAEYLSTSARSKKPNKLMPETSNTFLSPFSICTRGDRAPSEGYLCSSGYSSVASSNNKLSANEIDDHNYKMSNDFVLSIKVPPLQGNSQGKRNIGGTFERAEKKSDSETLSDETILESNDEGIVTDHAEDVVKQTEDLLSFVEEGNAFMPEEIIKTQLQLPSIVIGTEKLSPVSSRSESPMSDRNIMGKFSAQFFGKKDQQLPFTDSDGLYDFSSDGKGAINPISHSKKSLGRRRERRSSKTSKTKAPIQSKAKNFISFPDLPQSPSIHLEIPGSASSSQSHHASLKHHSPINFPRKCPKKKSPKRYTPSSSSSSNESLTTNSFTKDYGRCNFAFDNSSGSAEVKSVVTDKAVIFVP